MRGVKLKLTLTEGLKDLPQMKRLLLVEELRKALDVTASALVAHAQSTAPPAKEEHNVWARNDEELLADAEDALYLELLTPSMDAMACLIGALGLSNETFDLQKAYTDEFTAYEDTLIKGKDNGRHRMSDLINLSKEKRQDFLKFLQEGSTWTKRKLAEVDKILKQKLPDYALIAEQFMIRASFIAKVRAQADTSDLDMAGAFIDRFPKTIKASQHEGLVLTLRDKERENALGKKVKILPLQPQEVRTVEMADMRASAKLAEISDRHRAGVKEVILQAINGRWSAQQLAQALFDQFGDQNRDWRRVAITELAMASNDAYLAGCTEGAKVICNTVDGACKYCKEYLEGKEFTVTHDPKKMGNTHLQEMTYLWTGKTNFGRKLATWLPCVPLHPNCRHRLHQLSRFYAVDETGKPKLRPVNELIQEERVRRGLGLDPALK